MSTAAVDFSTKQLVSLLRTTRANNKADGITGMLLFRSGNFMQALEGASSVVAATLARIRSDKRHRDVTVIADMTLPKRNFSDWEMGFAHLDDPAVANVPGFTEFLERGLRTPEIAGNPGFAMKMLIHFRDNMR